MWSRLTKSALSVFLGAALLVLPVRAEPAAAPAPDPAPLQLDVKINGYPLKLIGAFKQYPDGHMASARSELTELGIIVPGTGPADETIDLEKLPGVTYAYDQASQSIDIKLPGSEQVAKEVKIGLGNEQLKAESGTGFVLNYTAFAAADYKSQLAQATIDGANLSLDARAFSKFGTVRQTGIVGTTTFSDLTELRLDSTYTFSDQENMRTYRLGDIISGGLRWTRPIRMGGGQVQRNFGLRPDLITMPLPFIQGTAAVPSTVDVYIDNMKAYSSKVDPGRFNLSDIPVFTSSGKAKMVLTDSSGNTTQTETDFYTSPDMLKSKLFDYSLDIGAVRRNYGVDSFGYDNEPVATGSFRYGISDSITAESHIEGKMDLIDAGVGVIASAKQFGLFSGAIAASKYNDKQGLFAYAGWEDKFGNLSIHASTSRTFGDYYDLAAATELPDKNGNFFGGVPQALDQLSLGYGLPSTKTGLALNFIHQIKSGSPESFILSGSVSQQLPYNISLFASGYNDFGASGDQGLFFGFSMPLGATNSTSAGISKDKSGYITTAEVSHPFGEKVGDYGYRVSASKAANSQATASGQYRTGKGIATGIIAAQGLNSVAGSASFSGSAIVAGGSAFLGDPVNDAFAVVDAGAPDVRVDYENRPVGRTGKNGKLLLPGLHSYQKNRIAINVNDLPIGATVKMSDTQVVPADATGLTVDFGVKTNPAAVLITLTDAAGKVIPEGSEGSLNGSSGGFFVGYDGQIFVTGAEEHNKLSIKLAASTCETSFDFDPKAGPQQAIGPLKCL